MVQKLWLEDTDNFLLFDAWDLDRDPMTLVLKLVLDIMVTYLHTKMRSIFQKLWPDKLTHTHMSHGEMLTE